MKTKRTITKTLWNSFLIIFLGTLLAVQAHAQIYVVDQCDGTIGKYDATTGATINPSLVSGLFYPNSIAVSGGNLLVAQYGGPIGEYDANTGATINASFVSASSLGIAVSGGKLFVTSYSGCGSPGSVSAYDATTGATINALL